MRSNSVFNNTFWILFGSACNKVSSIVLLYLLSRYLGVGDFGKFSFVFFYISLFGAVAEMGLTPILIKYLSVNDKRCGEVLGRGILIGGACTIFAILLAWTGALLLGYAPDIRHLIFIASLNLLISFRDVTFRWILEAPYRARLKMAFPVLLGIISETLGLVFIIFIISAKGSLDTIIAAYVLSNLPGFMLLAIMSVRSTRPSFRDKSISSAVIFKEALPIGSSNILSSIYLVLGSLVLFHYSGPEDVGYYALAFRLTVSLRIIPEAMMHSIFPLLAKAFQGDIKGISHIYAVAIRYGSLIAFPLVLGTMIVAKPVALLLGGESFQPASIALSIMIWATFISFFNTVVRFTFNAINLQKYNFIISIIMISASAAFSFLLIPKYGFAGASLALVASEFTAMAASFIVAGSFGLAVPFRIISKYFIASLGMSAGILFLQSLSLQLLIGMVIYIAIVVLIGGVQKDELVSMLQRG
ncbi:MAG: flippase [Deltaproteobacteria bacterium]|nr:flippase [Deltaproteobacteria bacterium]